MTAASHEGPVFYPALRYRDAPAAIAWLERAFGFEPILVVPDGDDRIAHAELGFAGGVLMLGSSGGGTNGSTEAPYVHVIDVDAHAARAASAGARITLGPEDKPYGGRGYSCLDLEGNEWSFGAYRPVHRRSDSRCHGVTPYLCYEDAVGALNWLTNVLGCEEVARYLDADGVVREAEVRAGAQEIWLAGMDPGHWESRGGGPDQLLLLWTADVDAHHARALAAGAQATAPANQPFGVRSYDLVDPEGYKWCIMQRLGTAVTLQPGWREVKHGAQPE